MNIGGYRVAQSGESIDEEIELGVEVKVYL